MTTDVERSLNVGSPEEPWSHVTRRRRVGSDRKSYEPRVRQGWSEMIRVRRSEIDGLCATWLLSWDHLISVVAVHDTSDTLAVVSFGTDGYPDLARARELRPELATLWDAVRHDFWNEITSPNPRSFR
ncbi:hypothetical protein IFM12275_24680 [Nocardia sputorum]|nr:hypothetical protein IFM12275_24680 [Nocardia sputorum]